MEICQSSYELKFEVDSVVSRCNGLLTRSSDIRSIRPCFGWGSTCLQSKVSKGRSLHFIWGPFAVFALQLSTSFGTCAVCRLRCLSSSCLKLCMKGKECALSRRAVAAASASCLWIDVLRALGLFTLKWSCCYNVQTGPRFQIVT